MLPFLHQDEMKPDHQYTKQGYCDPNFKKQCYLVRSAVLVLFIQVDKELFDVRVVVRTQHPHPCGAVVEPGREDKGLVSSQFQILKSTRGNL